MSQTPGSRKSPRFLNRQEDPDAINIAEERDNTTKTLQHNMERLNINAQVYNPPTNNAATGNAEFMVEAASSNLNLPSFWLERPHTWFSMCESAFATRNIVSPLTKYHYCVGKLPVETVASIEDVVNNFTAFADPYEELKKCLCRAYGCTEQQKVNDLLDLPPLVAEKPSVLMDNILSLWPDVTTKLTSKLLLGMCSTIDEKRFVFIM